MKNAIKVLCFVLAVIIIGTTAGLVYFKWDVGDFTYEDGVENGTVQITSYTGASVNIEIPNRLRGKKVVSIYDEAFSGGNIVSLKMNDYITSLGNNAFESCKSLETVDLGDNIKSLGDNCFANCLALKNVKMSNSLKSIGTSVFGGDTALENVDFSECENFVCEDGILYDKEKTTLFDVLPYAKITDFVFPSTVTKINKYAFLLHSELKSVTFNESIKTIPEGCFIKCTSLTDIKLPSNVTRIDALAFSTSGLKNITIPKSVTQISDSAFYNSEKQVTIHTSKDSKAEKYAKDKDIKCKLD